MSIVVHVNRFILQNNREKKRNDPAYCIHVNREPEFPYLGRFRRLAGFGRWEFEEGRTTPIPEPDTPAGATNVMIVPEDCSIWALEDNGEWKWLGQDLPKLSDIEALPLDAQQGWLESYIEGTFDKETSLEGVAPFEIRPVYADDHTNGANHYHKHSHGLRWTGRYWDGFKHSHMHGHTIDLPPVQSRPGNVLEPYVDDHEHIAADFHYLGHSNLDLTNEEQITVDNQTPRQQFEAAFKSAADQVEQGEGNVLGAIGGRWDDIYDFFTNGVDFSYSDEDNDLSTDTLDEQVKGLAQLVTDLSTALTAVQNILNCATQARDTYVERPEEPEDEDEYEDEDERVEGGVMINGEFIPTSTGS